jgi:hypothetical protein
MDQANIFFVEKAYSSHYCPEGDGQCTARVPSQLRTGRISISKTIINLNLFSDGY